MSLETFFLRHPYHFQTRFLPIFSQYLLSGLNDNILPKPDLSVSLAHFCGSITTKLDDAYREAVLTFLRNQIDQPTVSLLNILKSIFYNPSLHISNKNLVELADQGLLEPHFSTLPDESVVLQKSFLIFK